jgi:hypothetical protein
MVQLKPQALHPAAAAAAAAGIAAPLPRWTHLTASLWIVCLCENAPLLLLLLLVVLLRHFPLNGSHRIC